ncbi:hypothetical protein IW261DRAFT_1510753 [Armillaria novae-zelandiae]|uniref:F-box domain-containing protein n=1 Tax=Armillaria novae-zelandiae TaxID=153914 RepID=A0AA39NU26_9AGAR|nr:hypothetical protein IW261DRAFT_1510753 [Armillaria novae-zelandiae]
MFSTQSGFNKCPLCGPVERQGFPQSARAPRVLQLLQCNEPPTDAELSEFQETVQSAPGRLADLDEKIAHARKNLDALTLERISIEADMTDAKVLSSPVRRLPPDIVRAICLDTIPSPFEIMSILEDHGSLNSTKPPWTLSQVYRSWRSIIITSPELWSSVSLVLSNSFSSSIFSQMFMLGLRFERSQSAPLTVACFSTSDISSHPLLSLIITRISTIKNLRVDCPFQSLAALSFCRGRLELLHHLKIRASNNNIGSFSVLGGNSLNLGAGIRATPNSPSIDAFEYAPNLQRFSAYGILPQPIPLVPWTQLTHCGLQIDYLRELEVLRHGKNLHDLEIRTGAAFAAGEGYTPVSLPLLTSLTLTSTKMPGGSPEIRSIFSLLSVPNIVNLHLKYAGMPVLPHIKAQNTIRTLEIMQLSTAAVSRAEKYIAPGLQKLLNSVNNLQHLILWSVRALSSDDISLLNPSPTNASLPHLKTLDVRGCTLNFDHHIFVGMVNTRRGGGDTEWDQLETVYLDSSLVLDDFSAGVWQGLVDDGLQVVKDAP